MEECMKDGMFCYKYPRPAVATDCVVFAFDGKELQVLLIQRGGEPYKGMWAFPGGFLNMDETVEEGARRELLEETSFVPGVLEQFHTFSKVDRDPRERVLSVAFYALAKFAEVRGGDDAVDARWFPVDQLPKLAFDHAEIFQMALERLREKIHFEPVGFELLDESFSIPQLQRLYEAILGTRFDRRNFHRKILQFGILEPVKTEPGEKKKVDYDAVWESKLVIRDVNQLFCAEPPGEYYACPSYSKSKKTSNDSICSDIRPIESVAEDAAVVHNAEVGRKPQKFRFNLLEYLKLKKNKNFRLEF